jgi:hypothetical protein
MSLTYEWKLKSIKKQNDPSLQLNDIIVQTYWELIGTDENGNSGTFTGATPFSPQQVDPENYTEYANLTESQILGWIEDVVTNNESYKTHIDQRILKQIESKIKPIVEVTENFPWASNNEQGV